MQLDRESLLAEPALLVALPWMDPVAVRVDRSREGGVHSVRLVRSADRWWVQAWVQVSEQDLFDRWDLVFQSGLRHARPQRAFGLGENLAMTVTLAMVEQLAVELWVESWAELAATPPLVAQAAAQEGV